MNARLLCLSLVLPALVCLPPQAAVGQTPEAMAAGPLAGLSENLERLAERVSPAVVQILTTAYAPGQGLVPTSGELLTTERGSGSGVILDARGYVVTNAHVVEGARRIQVELSRTPTPGQSILQERPRLVGAQLVGIDQETDLAVLKLQTDATDLPVIEMADSDGLRVGELVLAFGSPLGLRNSVSLGIVSAVARQLRSEDPMIYLQTDAPINPGSSGGPLVDTAGRLVGINTSILSQSGGNEGIGFAAPSNIVRTVFEQIRDTGRVRRGEIGVRAQTITPVLAAGLGLPVQSGAVVADVIPDGTARGAGVEVGDIVLALDGKPIENGRQLHVNLYQRAVGDVVKLQVRRGDRTLTLPVAVAERPRDPGQLLTLVDPARNLVARLGILALGLDSTTARMLPPLRGARGVVVAATAADAPTARAGGLQPGDVIYRLNTTPVAGLPELHASLEGLSAGDAVVLQIERQGALMFLGFALE